MSAKPIKIVGSHGNLMCSSWDGLVMSADPGYFHIVTIDIDRLVKEHPDVYGAAIESVEYGIDILICGYTTEDGTYEPPSIIRH